MIEDFQNAFVRLATDSGLRTEYYTTGDEALAAYDLTTAEGQALAGIPRPDFERFAAALIAKRALAFEKVIPLTLRACPSLKERYRDWLADHPAPRQETVLSPGLAEGLRALATLRQAVEGDLGEAPYVGEALAFEVLGQASRIDGEERSLTSRFAVDQILRDLERSVLAIDPDVAPSRYRFTRQGIEWQRLADSEPPRAS